MNIYWGMTATRSYKKTIPANEAVIISACGLWDSDRNCFAKKHKLIWLDLALDSGGFVALNKWGDFPFQPDTYLNLIAELDPTWAASMDYPCEPDIAKGTKLSVSDRITATVENAVYLCSKDSRVMPVLQGYTLTEYEDCWRQLSNRMEIRRLAIGSLCKRQSTKEIAGLCWGFRQFLPDIPIHGFGIKLRALAYPETWGLFSSIDTDAWEFYKRTRYWQTSKDPMNKMTDAEAWRFYSDKVNKAKKAPRQLMLGKTTKD